MWATKGMYSILTQVADNPKKNVKIMLNYFF
jgi:hypothetical protein